MAHGTLYAMREVMAQTNDETRLRQIADDKSLSGELPSSAHTRVWAGAGTGQTCALCELRIDPTQVEYEVETQRHDGGPLYFHELCYRLWSHG
jgi:hypothetical protein